MKKILLRVGIGVVVLIVLGVLAVSLFLDKAVKEGVETLGPMITKVDVKLNSASLSLLSGSGSLKGLVVGNPAGYKTPHAISVGLASLAVKPTSLFSDKIVVKSIRVEAPEITFEGGFGGNNLKQILDNVESASGGKNAKPEAKPAEEKPGKKLEVDDFVITGAKLNVSVTGMGGKSIPVVLPDIHLSGLGTGPDGITAAELTKLVLSEVEKTAVKAADSAVANLGNNTEDLGKNAAGAAENAAKGLGSLFKKK